jgi:hypothetical protein
LREVDSGNIENVWLFHQSDSSGPFHISEFAEGVRAGNWPPNAVVALDNLTTFRSVHELLVELKLAVKPETPDSNWTKAVPGETSMNVISSVLASIVLDAFGFPSD